ncbi:MAG TPA: DUF4266 domain-containing protein [Haliangiales bacterium]|nr:DUF4266 domain-containing protein [Haliangiales bacterium]
MKRRALLAALCVVFTIVAGCAIVPQTHRRWLADPTMQPTESPLEDKARRKLHTTREGAAGGDGEPAGGGCGCGN